MLSWETMGGPLVIVHHLGISIWAQLVDLGIWHCSGHDTTGSWETWLETWQWEWGFGWRTFRKIRETSWSRVNFRGMTTPFSGWNNYSTQPDGSISTTASCLELSSRPSFWTHCPLKGVEPRIINGNFHIRGFISTHFGAKTSTPLQKMEIAFGNLRNKPVTYASNIWDRGYANCAGHCIVCASAMKALGVPYCVVTLRSRVKGKPKHAIMQVGFSEDTDIRPLGGAIFVFFLGGNCRNHRRRNGSTFDSLRKQQFLRVLIICGIELSPRTGIQFRHVWSMSTCCQILFWRQLVGMGTIITPQNLSIKHCPTLSFQTSALNGHTHMPSFDC